jgi:predicted transcriptional regulator
MSAMDQQYGGNHYKTMMIQPLEYALANNLGICEHAVVKYISRWREKGGVEDLRKAKHYIEILIEREISEKPALDQR